MVDLIDWNLRFEAVAFVPRLRIDPNIPACVPACLRELLTLFTLCSKLLFQAPRAPSPATPSLRRFILSAQYLQSRSSSSL